MPNRTAFSHKPQGRDHLGVPKPPVRNFLWKIVKTSFPVGYFGKNL